MIDVAFLSVGQLVAIVLAVPVAAILVVALLIAVVAIGLGVAALASWALTRASAAVLGEPGEIWR
ncbi:MAG: hypothetical protein JSU06_11795 [Actinobacteria bacterium]|nr:hypothetical protein [Actinomycetota bacterium]